MCYAIDVLYLCGKIEITTLLIDYTKGFCPKSNWFKDHENAH